MLHFLRLEIDQEFIKNIPLMDSDAAKLQTLSKHYIRNAMMIT